MANQLSYSKISSYSLCGQRYNLRYNHKLYERFQRASLSFGGAIDKALNCLLETKDLEKATKVFDKEWHFQFINKKLTSLLDNPNILFADKDLDLELIAVTEEQNEWVKAFKEFKKGCKWEEIDEEDRKTYNNLCWASLYAKGLIILISYHDKILPKFATIEAVQHKSYLTNANGDTVVQYLDFIVTLAEDGARVLMDNKTTSSLSYYDEDSPGTSQQLISYYYANKEEFKLEKVGFCAILKEIIKNKKKTCKICGKMAEEGSRVKTCAEENSLNTKGKPLRCNGEFDVTMDPEAAIVIYTSVVSEAAEDLVLSTFDEANEGISKQLWTKNLMACKNIFGSPCEYFSLCWKGEKGNLIDGNEPVVVEESI